MTVGLGALIAVGGLPGAAGAQSCRDGGERLAFVGQRLRDDARDARLWAWGWGLGYAALTVGQAALGASRSDRGQRAELYVGAGKSALGLIPVLLVPVPARRDAAELDARIAAAPDADARCTLIADGEAALRRSADDEAFARSWLAHAATVAVNGGGLLIVGLGYGRWATGTAGALIGTLVGEIQIFTRPTGALRGERAYEARWSVVPLITRDAAGLQLAGWFGY